MNVLNFLSPIMPSTTSTPRAKKSNQFDIFLLQLNNMFQRVNPSDLDGSLSELRDAMKRQLEGSFRSPRSVNSNNNSPTSSFRGLENSSYEFTKKMLDELAGKTFRSPNALERELKCDRFIAAYCALQQLIEKIDTRARSSANFERSFKLKQALDFELNPIPSEDSAEKEYSPKEMRKSMMLTSRAKTPASSARLGMADPRAMELKRQRSMKATAITLDQPISSLACRGLMQYM